MLAMQELAPLLLLANLITVFLLSPSFADMSNLSSSSQCVTAFLFSSCGNTSLDCFDHQFFVFIPKLTGGVELFSRY